MIHSIFKKLNLPSGSVLWDLGSGDGRVVEVSVVNYGLKAFGFEINDTYYRDSLQRISKIPLNLRKNASILKKDIFNLNLTHIKIDVLFIYATVYAYRFLQHVLKTAKPGLKIVCVRYCPSPEQIKELGLTLIDEIPEQDYVIDVEIPDVIENADEESNIDTMEKGEEKIRKVKRKLYMPFGAKIFQKN
jgi:hypothetical protein